MSKALKFLAMLSPLYYLKASVAQAGLPAVEVGLDGAEAGLEDVGSGSGLESTSLPTLIGNIIEIVLGLLGIVFIVLIVYAGFLWMTAGGSSDQTKKAKAILTNSIIGLIITLAAYAISAYVISAIVAAAEGT